MKKLVLPLLIVLVLGMSGCAETANDSAYNDDKVLANKDQYNIIEFTGSMVQKGEYSFTVERISGARTIWSHVVLNDDEILNFDCTLEECQGGWSKLVLIEPDGNVITLLEANLSSETKEYSIAAQKGNYCIKVVGKDKPKLKGTFQFSKGEIGQEE